MAQRICRLRSRSSPHAMYSRCRFYLSDPRLSGDRSNLSPESNHVAQGAQVFALLRSHRRLVCLPVIAAGLIAKLVELGLQRIRHGGRGGSQIIFRILITGLVIEFAPGARTKRYLPVRMERIELQPNARCG